MDTPEEAPRRRVCVVPYRWSSARVEFLLVRPDRNSRWQFPEAIVLQHESDQAALQRELSEKAGIEGEIVGTVPLDEFTAARGDNNHTVVAYLVLVSHNDENWPPITGPKRHWCLVEEARLRIRRKPLRRLLDLAMRRIQQDSSNAPDAS